MIDRRRFLLTGSAGLLGLPALIDARANADTFRFAVIADTHIVDDFYRGPAQTNEDTLSLLETSKRLAATRSFLNALQPPIDLVFLVGDYFHDYPSPDIGFYFINSTRIDRAKALTDGFRMPIHVGFGNHDYGVPTISREMSHELFRRKLSLTPYYAVEHRGIKFLHVNNFLGATWDPKSPAFDLKVGSLGETQLTWLDAQLAERTPTFVFVHFPLPAIAPREVADLGMVSVLRKHQGTVLRVISGHWHRWVERGTEFGPRHLVIAATRYDEDAYLIVEVDTRAGTHRELNLGLVEWDTHYSKPFTQA